ncbi:MAG: queuosine precursor transporter [Pelagibacteraceae bacterium]|nr:queuosine precursor transporter [Pelagibacteraceae bacterium]MCI5078770.1 queuosine precursor transporter [Pelagibacteraceae bacterium]
MSYKKIIPYILAMMLIVLASNYLVQFPLNFFNLHNLLTWGAFTYPVAFLVTDLANRIHGINFTRKVIHIGFIWGVLISLFFSISDFNLISLRIVIGSGTAFLIAQLLDANIFNKLRDNKYWFVPPFLSSIISSAIDTILFFSIAFYGTDVPWVTLALGDFIVKIIIAMLMLVPFRLILKNFDLVQGSFSNR